MALKSYEENMLKLIAVSMNGENYAEIPDLSSWQEIKKELEAHAVLPIVSDYVLQTGISDSDKFEVIKKTVNNMHTFDRLMTRENLFLMLMEENHIPVAILKGAAAAQYYPQPNLRQLGDIDALVLPEDYERAFHLLKDNGYRNLQDFDDVNERHIGFMAEDGFEIEMHRFFSHRRGSELNILDEWLFSKLPGIRTLEIEGFTVPVFPPVENGVILLQHINQHLNMGLGLRQIIDWMMYVKAELNDSLWEKEFCIKAESLGLKNLAKTTTKMCRKYLGLSSEISWCDDADIALADEMMEYILKKGNFGGKIRNDNIATISTAHHFSNLSSAFEYLTNTGMGNMKKAGFKPRESVAWIYQIGHLMKMTMKRKNKGNIGRELKISRKEADFLDRLKQNDLG